MPLRRTTDLRGTLLAPLSLARRLRGTRLVNWTPPFMNFGNQLYLWAWAHAGRDETPARKVLITDSTRYWLPFVPDLAERFLIERDDVRFLDQRIHAWASPLEHSGDPRGFTLDSRTAFIRDCLLPAPLCAGVGEGPLASGDVLTLNVRRGDFYSNPYHRAQWGMDQAAYLRKAVEGSLDQDGPVRRIHVVSDGIDWCRGLDWLPSYAPEVTFAEGESPAENFRDVAGSRRLVVSNSTFSLWAAFTSVTVFGDDAQIWAPAFFQRSHGPGRSHEYDADWSFVDDLPDGWQPDWLLKGCPI